MTITIVKSKTLDEQLLAVSELRCIEVSALYTVVHKLQNYLLTGSLDLTAEEIGPRRQPHSVFSRQFEVLGTTVDEAAQLIQKACLNLANQVSSASQTSVRELYQNYLKQLEGSTAFYANLFAKSRISKKILASEGDMLYEICSALGKNNSVVDVEFMAIVSDLCSFLTHGHQRQESLAPKMIGQSRIYQRVFIKLFMSRGLSESQARMLVRIIPRDLAHRLVTDEHNQQTLHRKFKKALTQSCRGKQD